MDNILVEFMVLDADGVVGYVLVKYVFPNAVTFFPCSCLTCVYPPADKFIKSFMFVSQGFVYVLCKVPPDLMSWYVNLHSCVVLHILIFEIARNWPGLLGLWSA